MGIEATVWSFSISFISCDSGIPLSNRLTCMQALNGTKAKELDDFAHLLFLFFLLLFSLFFTWCLVN